MSSPGVTVIKPRGRLDALGAAELWNELEPIVTTAGARLVLDLTQVRYISSEGLRVLLRAQRATERSGGGLNLCGLSPRLTEIISMAGLDRVYHMYPDCAKAQRAFQQAGGAALDDSSSER